MKIIVITKPWAKVDRVEPILGGAYKVFVKAPAQDGKSNERLLKILAKHFDVPPSTLSIISGQTSRQKIIEIANL